MSEISQVHGVGVTAEISGTNVQGVSLPRIGLGTWPMVGQECTDAVLMALGNGYRHIDTAENYGNEDAVGAALRTTSVERDEIFVTTKINAKSHGSLDVVRPAVEERLRVLQLEQVDMVLIHWPNPKQDSYIETAEALAELVDEGLMRSWGVSNFKPHHLERLIDQGLTPPVNQIQLDPLVQQHATETANAMANTMTAAYSPVGRDLDLGQYRALTNPATRLGRTEHQIVLRWHLQKGRVAVPKSAHEQRQQQNLNVFDFELTNAEMAAIDGLNTNAGPRRDADEYGH